MLSDYFLPTGAFITPLLLEWDSSTAAPFREANTITPCFHKAYALSELSGRKKKKKNRLEVRNNYNLRQLIKLPFCTVCMISHFNDMRNWGTR